MLVQHPTVRAGGTRTSVLCTHTLSPWNSRLLHILTSREGGGVSSQGHLTRKAGPLEGSGEMVELGQEGEEEGNGQRTELEEHWAPLPSQGLSSLFLLPMDRAVKQSAPSHNKEGSWRCIQISLMPKSTLLTFVFKFDSYL